MDATVAALLGLLIGGSLALWVAQRLQVRSQWLAQKIRRRQQFYGEFIGAAGCCYAGALQGKKPDPGSLARIHKQIRRMRYQSSDAVVREAIGVAGKVRDACRNPDRTRAGMDVPGNELMEFLGDFSDACRAELLYLQRHGVVQEQPRRFDWLTFRI